MHFAAGFRPGMHFLGGYGWTPGFCATLANQLFSHQPTCVGAVLCFTYTALALLYLPYPVCQHTPPTHPSATCTHPTCVGAVLDLRVEPDAACGTPLLGPGPRHILQREWERFSLSYELPIRKQITGDAARRVACTYNATEAQQAGAACVVYMLAV